MLQSIINSLFRQVRQEEITKAQQRAKEILLKANEDALSIKQDAEKQASSAINKTIDIEKRLSQKEQRLEDRGKQLSSGEQSLRTKELSIEKIIKDNL